MRKQLLIIAMLVMAVLPSCKRSMTDIKNPGDPNWIAETDQSFETEFKAIWEAMNQSYVLWDIDPIDWDARRDNMIELGKKYDEMQRQGTLDFTSPERMKEMNKLFEGLLDHHLSIAIQNPYDTAVKRHWVSPGTMEVESRAGYHKKYDIPTTHNVIKKMIDNGQLVAESVSVAPFVSSDFEGVTYVMTGIFKVNDGFVAYIRFSDYNITEIFNKASEGEQSEAYKLIDNHFINVKKLKDQGVLKGIILDNRGNGGGYHSDARFIVGPYITSDMLMFYCRTKNGLGKYDYSLWEENKIATWNTVIDWYVGDLGNIPYVAIEDMNSVSMGEITGSCVAQLKSGVIIGERSFGGHGGLNISLTYEQQGWCGIIKYDKYHHELYNPLKCCKIWNNRTKQFEMQEGVGLIPDIEVKLDEVKFAAGYDNQLMRAIEYIKTGR